MRRWGKCGLVVMAALLLFVASAAAADERIKFKRLSVDDGLSQSTVFAIAQDARGAMWLGTADGLNKYDCYSFRTYRNLPSDSTSLAENSINSLLTDGAGDLWVGTGGNLSRYDYLSDSFHNYPIGIPNAVIHSIVETPDRKGLLLATEGGLVSFDKRSCRLTINRTLAGVTLHALAIFKSNVLVGTAQGLYLYSPSTGVARRVVPELDGSDIADVIYAPQQGGVYVATHGKGLFLIDDRMNILRNYGRATTSKYGAMSDYIRVLEKDAEGDIWVGTYDGLFIFTPSKERFRSYRYDHSDISSISHNSIRSICTDTQGGMWIGTFYGGVNYYNAMSNNFSTIQRSLNANSLGDNTISCIVEEAETGNLWIGANDNGVTYYNILTKQFDHFVTADSGLRSNNIKCILPDGAGIWIGTHTGGLSYMSKGSRNIVNYQIYNDIPINNSCYSMLDRGDGTLWVGTLSGLLSFDKSTKKFSPHPVALLASELGSTMILTLTLDSEGGVWIGTSTGLWLYTPQKHSLQRLLDRNSYVMAVQESEAATDIWIGTRGGLFRYNREQAKMTHLTTRQGLPNDFIYGILEDQSGALWLSTNNGLACYSPKSGNVRSYTKSDGLCNNQFNLYSYCKSRDGELYFGGINGITHFNPRKLTDNPFTPKVYITDVRLLYDDELSHDKVRREQDSLGNITSAWFSSKYNLFSIGFVVINPLAGNRNEFSYKLEGFDKTWYTTTNQEINYSNISPGSYRLLVKAANNDGFVGEGVTELKIYVEPMWYQTTLATILYVVMFFVALAVGFKFFISRAKMRMQLLLERIEMRKVRELSEEKIRFYINISHELRTPLALILSPLQEIIDSGIHDKFVGQKLEYIRRNSTRLLHIINQQLEYRKAELGVLKIQVGMVNVEEAVADVFSMFEDNANHRDMDYIFNSSIDQKLYPIDRRILDMIVINLLANAFKFTPDAGSIRITLAESDGWLMLTIRDSGIGMAPENVTKIFDRFYQENESRAGTGIGLSIVKRIVDIHHGTISVDSRQGEFTQFTIQFPTDISVYSPHELATEDQKYSKYSLERSRDISLYMESDSDSMGAGDTPGDGPGEHQETILIVDDNREMLSYLRENFSKRYNVYTASSGSQALEIIKSTEPDVVLTDLMMQGMSGYELCKAIKQNIRTCHISVVILTAKEDVQDQIAAIEGGADEYLFKPFSISILRAKVSNLIKAKYRHRNLYMNTREVEPEKITSNAMDGEFLRKAVDVVERNMDNEEFTSLEFSRELCMSRSNLHLKMTSLTGESAAKFIRKIRLNHACKLLLEGKYAVAEISSMTGFSTPSYFATCFKKHIGCMPTEYGKGGRLLPDQEV